MCSACYYRGIVDIKTIFHILALLSAILAGASTLINSPNKIVYFVLFSVIAASFEVAIPFLKKPFSPPLPIYKLYNTKEKYEQGLDLYDIKWEKDFLMYQFTFRNDSKISTMEDIRLRFETPGVFVKHIISTQEGIESINLSSENDYMRKVHPQTKTIIDTMPLRSNMFTFNISKAHPNSFIDLKLIFNGNTRKADVSGYFTISYSFIGEKGEKKKERKIHPIIIKDLNDWAIEVSKEIKSLDNTTHSFNMMPIKPISNK